MATIVVSIACGKPCQSVEAQVWPGLHGTKQICSATICFRVRLYFCRHIFRTVRLDFVGSKLHDDPELRTLEAATTHSANLLVAEARAHQLHGSVRTAIYIDAHDLLLRPPLGWINLQSD